MNAVGYARVSTEGQAHDGISLEAQQARIAAWCQANGYDLKGVRVDAGLSGGRADNRPALQAALAEACQHKAALIVYSLSRLARSTKDAIAISERLAKGGADLVSLTERIDTASAGGRLFFRLMISLSEFERDLGAERTRCAMDHLRNQNRRISGRIPFGYSLAPNGTDLVPQPKEQQAIKLMQALREEGYSLRAIARALTDRGIHSKTRTAWTAEVIRGILRRKVA